MAELEHNQIEIWRAEAVKSWTQALANLTAARILDSEDMDKAIIVKIKQLLGIADDEGSK